MTYVIYHISSTMQVGPTERGNPHSLYAKTYKTQGAALRTARKFDEIARRVDTTVNGQPTHHAAVYGVASVEDYRSQVVRMVTRKNLLSGKEYQEASNTPGFCSPSSEAYWSM
jgi:hypothetical protein